MSEHTSNDVAVDERFHGDPAPSGEPSPADGSPAAPDAFAGRPTDPSPYQAAAGDPEVAASGPERDVPPTDDRPEAAGDRVEGGASADDVSAEKAELGDEDEDAGEGDAEDEDGDEDAEDRGRSDDPLDAEGEIAADYLEELLDIADLDGDIDTYVESGRAHVSIVTDAQVLVGKDGEVLESLQDLVRLAVVAETGHRSRLMLDVAGHREKRRRELVDLAADAVQEVRTSQEAVRLSPMNPFERKIVHDAVAAAGLTSESEGEEPQRRVVVLP